MNNRKALIEMELASKNFALAYECLKEMSEYLTQFVEHFTEAQATSEMKECEQHKRLSQATLIMYNHLSMELTQCMAFMQVRELGSLLELGQNNLVMDGFYKETYFVELKEEELKAILDNYHNERTEIKHFHSAIQMIQDVYENIDNASKPSKN